MRVVEEIMDYTDGLNYEKSTNFTFLHIPELCNIYTASFDDKPPITLGAETPGINLLLIESTSKETKIISTYS